MAKTLSVASEEYVKLVNEVVAETGLDRMGVDFQVYNILNPKKEVIKVQRANEVAEILSNRQDLVIISIAEEIFDLVDEKTRRLWAEDALSNVSYDSEKEKLLIGKEPMISTTFGMYNKYGQLSIDMAELKILTLEQYLDKKKEEEERKKEEKKNKKKKQY